MSALNLAKSYYQLMSMTKHAMSISVSVMKSKSCAEGWAHQSANENESLEMSIWRRNESEALSAHEEEGESLKRKPEGSLGRPEMACLFS